MCSSHNTYAYYKNTYVTQFMGIIGSNYVVFPTSIAKKYASEFQYGASVAIPDKKEKERIRRNLFSDDDSLPLGDIK